MNQGRIWCVVNPTVGLPLLIGSAALTSLVVHGCILSHAEWFGKYWSTGVKEQSSMAAPGGGKSLAGYTVTVTPSATTGTTPASFTITVTPPAAGPAHAVTTAAAPAHAAVLTPIKAADAG